MTKKDLQIRYIVENFHLFEDKRDNVKGFIIDIKQLQSNYREYNGMVVYESIYPIMQKGNNYEERKNSCLRVITDICNQQGIKMFFVDTKGSIFMKEKHSIYFRYKNVRFNELFCL